MHLLSSVNDKVDLLMRHTSYFLLLNIALILNSFNCAAQESPHAIPNDLRFSAEANLGCYPCLDTLNFLGYKHVADLRPMLPAWRPVVSHDTCVVLEGLVLPIDGHDGPGWIPHVSWQDLPLYHYTHDVGFNVWPDRGYRNLMSRYVTTTQVEDGKEVLDTVIRKFVHCEWETGLAASNKGNPASGFNRVGNSFGMASKGHQRYDVIWNWPTIDDWVHLEGLWVWDRGHPPARTEIHPIRFMAIRRNLPEYVSTDNGNFAGTRVDVFANGDGSPFYNNWDTAAYVHPVRMSAKDYTFVVRNTLKQPDGAALKYTIKTRKGHSFEVDAQIKVFANSDSLRITIPWKGLNQPDTAVFAQTIYLYWEAEQGTVEEMTEYTLTLNRFKLRRMSEVWFLDPAEIRIFFNVGSDYIFFNEFASRKKDILRRGLGKTIKRHWKINQSFNLLVPQNRKFRVYAGGWEADGTDKVYGHIIDQFSPCEKEMKDWINDEMLDAWPVGLAGCEDDNLGESFQYHSPLNLPSDTTIQIKGHGKPYKENCPFGSRVPIDFHRLQYTIERK